MDTERIPNPYNRREIGEKYHPRDLNQTKKKGRKKICRFKIQKKKT